MKRASRQGIWRRWAPPRLRMTREGRIFLGITIGIGLAAVNTGNNLLYLVLGWLLSLIIASGVLSNLTLRGLRAGRRAPPRIFAGLPFLMEISLENRKKRFASFSIEVEDLMDARPLDKRCYFLKLPPGRTQRASYRHTFHRRGLYRLDGFRLATRFPFALFTKSREEPGLDEVLVYPAVRPVPLPAPRSPRHGDATQSRLGRRGEFFGLREYRDGDDSRAIHWHSSARAGRLLLREMEEEAQRRVVIELDNAVPDQADEAALEALEDAVTTAASLVVAYLRRGYAVRLVARGLDVPASAGPGHEHRLLRALALLEPASPSVPISGRVEPGAEAVRVGPRALAGAAEAEAG
ncbi:MAG TPA: DUF58 domain-containing protein [Candidatus Acidoferrum sp.]|nr:DUF58 domain-containing protein [Candidatus Acidoferrum sp.]